MGGDYMKVFYKSADFLSVENILFASNSLRGTPGILDRRVHCSAIIQIGLICIRVESCSFFDTKTSTSPHDF